MQSANQLQDMLRSINRKSYPAYKSLKGAYQFKKYVLSIDHVQGDPFASPSHISVKIFHREAGFPAEYYKDKLTRITLADYLTRQFEQQVNRYTFQAKGSGKSGLISVTRCGQEVLERTACEITEQGITIRFFVGFPANGRTINAGELEKIFFEFLPVCVEKAFVYRNLSGKDLENTIFLAEDQAYIREELKKRFLVAVVNDRAQRRAAGHAVAQSRKELRHIVLLPRGRKRAFSGFAPIQKGLQLRKINALARRQAIDAHADRGSVRLSEHADAQRSSEFRGHRSYLPAVCIPPRRRDRISAPPPRL